MIWDVLSTKRRTCLDYLDEEDYDGYTRCMVLRMHPYANVGDNLLVSRLFVYYVWSSVSLYLMSLTYRLCWPNVRHTLGIMRFVVDMYVLDDFYGGLLLLCVFGLWSVGRLLRNVWLRRAAYLLWVTIALVYLPHVYNRITRIQRLS